MEQTWKKATTAVVQTRDDSLALGCGGGEKWSHLGYILRGKVGRSCWWTGYGGRY